MQSRSVFISNYGPVFRASFSRAASAAHMYSATNRRCSEDTHAFQFGRNHGLRRGLMGKEVLPNESADVAWQRRHTLRECSRS
jgi:hypothetical protein